MSGDQTRSYRILPADEDAMPLLDQSDYQPVTVDLTERGSPALQTAVTGLRPGYLVDADLTWPAADQARFRSVTVTEYTLFTFERGVTGLFEAALDTWEDAQRAGDGINSRVTYSNDGRPNGALYTFAAQPGGDLFEEFRSGRRPIAPLLDRIDDPPPYEVFVFDVASHAFVLVYIVFAKGSILADTVRDTYDVPRPTEPLVETDADADGE